MPPLRSRTVTHGRNMAGARARDAFENAMALDVAMGGSTNTILHLLAAAATGAARDVSQLATGALAGPPEDSEGR